MCILKEMHLLILLLPKREENSSVRQRLPWVDNVWRCRHSARTSIGGFSQFFPWILGASVDGNGQPSLKKNPKVEISSHMVWRKEKRWKREAQDSHLVDWGHLVHIFFSVEFMNRIEDRLKGWLRARRAMRSLWRENENIVVFVRAVVIRTMQARNLRFYCVELGQHRKLNGENVNGEKSPGIG